MDTISVGSILIALIVGVVANRISQSFGQNNALRLRVIRIGSGKSSILFKSASVSTCNLIAITIKVGRFIEKPTNRA